MLTILHSAFRLICFAFCIALTFGLATPQLHAQEHVTTKEQVNFNAVDESNASDFSLFALWKVISGADGHRCPMYPSCSAYARDAVKKHGPLLGWIMTSDRLVRCGRDELKLGPAIRVNGSNQTYDPVENNDFWWK